MAHNKYLTLFFFVENHYIPAKSDAQVLSLNLACTCLLPHFLIPGLYNSSASCSFIIIPDPVFLSKNLETTLTNAL